MPWIGAAIGAGASLIGGQMSASNQRSTNAANMAITKETEAWEEKMSDTAMQRRVGDLKASGLNPMLAIGQGGASTPGMSPIAMQSSSAAGEGVSNAGQVAAKAVALENMKADTSVKEANAANIAADTANKPLQGNLLSAQTAVQNGTVASIAAGLGLTRAETENAIARKEGIEADSSMANLDSNQKMLTAKALVDATKAKYAADIAKSGYDVWLNTTAPGRLIQALGHGTEAGIVQGVSSGANSALKVDGAPRGGPDTSAKGVWDRFKDTDFGQRFTGKKGWGAP